MATTTLDIQAKVTGTTQAKSQVKAIGTGVDKLNKKVKAFTDRNKKMFDSFKKAGKAMSIMGAGAALLTKGVLDLANTQLRVEKQLESTLRSTGEAAGFSKRQLLDQASAFQNMTTIGDESIISLQDTLLTFTGIQGEAFEGATQAVLDMATNLNSGATPSMEQMKAQAIQVGKALNDPIKGVAALSRVGVVFTDDQKEMIKTLQESGDVMGAQKIILNELAVEFGGSAAAAAETFQGRMTQLNNVWGDFQEEVGFAIIDVLKPLIPVIKNIVGWFKNLSPEVKKVAGIILLAVTAFGLLGGPLLLLIGFLPAIASGFTMVSVAMSGIGGPIALIVAGLTLLFIAWQTNFLGIQDITAFVVESLEVAWQRLVDFWNAILLPALAAVQQFFSDVWNGIVDTVTFVSESLEVAWQRLVDFWNAILLPALAFVQDIFTKVWEFIAKIVMDKVKLVQDIFKAFVALFTGDWEGLKEAVMSIITNLWESATLIFRTAFDIIVALVKGAFPAVGEAFAMVFDKAKEIVVGAIDSIKQVIIDFVLWVPKQIAKAIDAISSSAGAFSSSVQGRLRSSSPFGSNIPGRASGGSVSGGDPFMVGERGPELFVPGVSGSIIPNNKLQTAGGMTLNISINTMIGEDEFVETLGNRIVEQVRLSTAF